MKNIIQSSIACILMACGHTSAADAGKESIPDLMAKVEAAANAGRIADADTLMENVLDTVRKEAGIDHPSVGMVLAKQGSLRMNTRRFAEAAASFAEATAMLEKSLGRENPIAFGARYQWIDALRKSNNAGAAADVARHLLETLTTLATSGRARQAGWDTVGVAPNQRMKFPVTPDDAGIAEVESTLALCLAEAGKADEAAPLLASALATTGKLYGQGHPRGVALQQAIEKIALARGEAIGRRHVGELTLTKNLVFEGNNGFPAADLIHGLARDAGVVLASHPAATFSAFLDAIQNALLRGYRAAGYPDVRVAMHYANAPGKPPGIVATVTEGPRFRNGTVTVNGAPPDLANGITRFLTEATPPWTNTLRQRIDTEILATVAPAEADTAKRAADSAEAATKAGTNEDPAPPSTAMWDKQMQMMTASNGSSPMVWESGAPMDFEDPSTIQQAVQSALSCSGYPLARWNHRIERRTGGTCDLVVTIDDTGPLAVLGSIKVIGNRKNQAEKIIGITGLKPGQALLPEHLAAARMALWDTGRFWPFVVQTKAMDGARQIDVVITVNELDKAPAIDVAPTDIQTIALRAVRTINETLATRGILVAGESGGTNYEIARDPDGTLAAKLTKAGEDQTVLMALDHGVLRVVIKDKSGIARFDLPVGQFTGALKILPERSSQKDWQMGLYVIFGAHGGGDGGQSALDFLASPAFAFLTDLDLGIKDGRMIGSSKGIEQFSIDTATGGLVAIAGLPVTIGDNMTKPLLNELNEAMKASGGITRSFAWPDILARLLASSLRDMRKDDTTRSSLEKPPEMANVPVALGAFAGDLLPATRNLTPEQIDAIERVTARMLGILTANHDEEESLPAKFHVPMNNTMDPNMTMPVLLGLGFLQLSEDIFPSDTWMSLLSRELLFSLSGNHLYTATVMDNLLADPEMGPLGSLLAARVIGMISPGHVRLFEEKALRQCHAAGFRRDWELAMRGDTGISRTTIRYFDAMAALTPAEEADIILLLGAGRSGWFKDLLVALRARPTGQSVAACVAPHMDALWTSHLGPWLSKALDARLHPPVDPTRVAAMVNGNPLPRVLVDYIQRLGGCPVVPGKRKDDHGGNTWKQARQDLIRLMLVRGEYLANGGTIDPAAVEKLFLGQLPPDLANADDATMQKSCGLTRAEARFYIELRAVLATAGGPRMTAVKAADAAEIARWQAGPGAGLFDEYHVHWMKTCGPDASPFHGQLMAVERLHALRALHAHGIPADILAAACQIDRGGLVDFQCQKALPNYGMNPSLGIAMTSMEPGGISQPVLAGGKTYLLLPVTRKPGTPPAGDTAAAIIASRATFAKQEQMVETWLEELEKHAEVTLIDGPEPDDKAWIATSKRTADAWSTEHSTSLVARLIAFWCAVHGKDDSAVDRALADLFHAPAFGAAELTELAAAVDTAGRPAHAKQLRDKAASLPKPASTTE